MNKLLRCILALTAVYILSGCNAPKNHLGKFDRFFEAGELERARTFAEKRICHKKEPRKEDLLWSLQIGAIDRMEKNYTQSTDMFDSCEEIMSHFDSEDSEIGHAIGATVVNDNVVPYTEQTYDGVMVNTYKGLNFMATGQFDLARVEFNRALDRQRRAKETFNKEIQKLKQDVHAENNSEYIQKSIDNPDLKQRLQEVYPSLYNFNVYPDFVNPFATYIAGLFFLVEGDYSKSVDLLKESAGMVPENTVILQDLDKVNHALNTGTSVEPSVWVIFENGLGPIKEEYRIDLPLFLATDKIHYAGIALPMLVFRPAAAPYLEVESGSIIARTQLVANMDFVIQTEFNKDFQGILTRAIISATAKAAAQYALQKDNNNSSWAAVAMAVYSLATTTADVRIWTTLPKNIQATSVLMPKNGHLTISGESISPTDVEIGDCTYAIVYIKIINAIHEPSIEVLTFN